MRIVVAMSGGVDSSVAAALLAERATTSSACRCSSTISATAPRPFGTLLLARRPARRAARRGARSAFPHYIVNFERSSTSTVVVELRARVRGRPHADSLRALQQRPEVRDAGRARRRVRRRRASPPATTRASSATSDRRRYRLRRGVDPAKDQSYFLFSLTQEQLAHAMFPVGDLTKADGARLRARAAACRSPTSRTARRSASSPTATTPAFVERQLGAERAAGRRSSTRRARVLGRHDGVHRFTVGQRKGLGLSRRRAALRAASSSRTTRAVVVGPREALGRRDADGVAA